MRFKSSRKYLFDERWIRDLDVTSCLLWSHHFEHECILNPKLDELEKALAPVSNENPPPLAICDRADLINVFLCVDVKMCSDIARNDITLNKLRLVLFRNAVQINFSRQIFAGDYDCS